MSVGPDTASSDSTTPVAQLGSRLRAARLEAGLTLRELARQLRVSPSFVSQLENGKSQPSVATLYSLSQLLDVSIDVLFEPEVLLDEDSVPGAGVDGAGVAGAEEVDGLDGAGDDGGRAGLFGSDGTPPVSVDEALRRPRRGSSRTSARTSRGTAGGTDQDGASVARSSLRSPADAWSDTPVSARCSVTGPGDRSRLVMDSGVIWEQLARNTDHHLDFIEITYPPGSSSTNDERMLRHQGFEYGYLLEGELQVTFGFDVFVLRAGESLGLDSSVPHLFTNTGEVAAKGIWFVHHRHD